MPNYKTVRSIKASGIRKAVETLPESAIPESADSTYPRTVDEGYAPDTKASNLDAATPVGRNAGVIPSSPTPFGVVDLGSVNKS